MQERILLAVLVTSRHPVVPAKAGTQILSFEEVADEHVVKAIPPSILEIHRASQSIIGYRYVAAFL